MSTRQRAGSPRAARRHARHTHSAAHSEAKSPCSQLSTRCSTSHGRPLATSARLEQQGTSAAAAGEGATAARRGATLSPHFRRAKWLNRDVCSSLFALLVAGAAADTSMAPWIAETEGRKMSEWRENNRSHLSRHHCC